MAVTKNPVATEPFINAGDLSIVTAKKGVQSLDLRTFSVYTQQAQPQGKNWVFAEQIVLPNTDWIPEGAVNKYGATEFTQLTDVPQTYAGASLKSVRVNAAETGLEFFSIPGSGITDLNGLNAAVQTFSKVDDTNMSLTITSAVADHQLALAWTGLLNPSRGGTGFDTSASTGVAQILAGVWSFSTTLTDGAKATTQAALDNSTLLATTAYVDSAIAVSGTVTSVASADGSILVTNPTTTVDLAVVSSPKLTTARTIGAVSFDGTANIVPQTIESADESADTTCFPLFITASGTQQLQPKNNAGLIYNALSNRLTAGQFIGALAGNATTATTASISTTSTIANEATDTTCFVNFTTDVTGNLGLKSNTALTFNSNTANLACTTFTGALVGNASTATNVAVGGITGLGTNVATALAINVGSAGAFVTFNGALGTPSSGTLTNATGLPVVAGTTGTLTVARGGTGVTTIAAKSIWLANAFDTITSVTPAAGQSIRINAGNTAWEAYTPVSSSGFATVALDNLAAVAINTTLLPASDDAIDLGSDTKRFHYLPFKLASGFIGWGTGGGDGAIDTSGTAGNSSLRFMNAASGYIFDAVIKPSSATVDLGVTSAAPFRNLFLAATGKVDWGNGDVTLTGGTNTLTFAGASSGYTFDAATTIGTANAFTCGTIELGAASDTTISRASAAVLNLEGVALLRSTCGVGTSPTATQTDTVTHNLSRVPVMIRIYGIGTFTSNAAATPTTHSVGIYNATGNRCVFQGYNTATITTTQAAGTSTTFAIRLDTGANSFITGVIQNVGATTFDIAWTETGTATAQSYLWEAQ